MLWLILTFFFFAGLSVILRLARATGLVPGPDVLVGASGAGGRGTGALLNQLFAVRGFASLSYCGLRR